MNGTQDREAVAIGRIARDLEAGKIVPFLGAGASAANRPVKATWEDGTSAFPPLGGELAESLADESGFPDQDERNRQDLPRIASYYEHVAVDRDGLRDRLRSVFKVRYEPGPLHRFLARLETPLLIMTTNYDDLIERAFDEQGTPYHLVVNPSDRADLAGAVLWRKPGANSFEEYRPNKLPLSLRGETIIYKMHGTCDPAREKNDHFVITEEDYVDFLASMAIPARFDLTFRKSRFLFFGYGLQDWNFRVMLRNLNRGGSATAGDNGRENRRRAWAIQHRPSSVEVELWQAKKVSIYDLKIDKFIGLLANNMTPP